MDDGGCCPTSDDSLCKQHVEMIPLSAAVRSKDLETPLGLCHTSCLTSCLRPSRSVLFIHARPLAASRLSHRLLVNVDNAANACEVGISNCPCIVCPTFIDGPQFGHCQRARTGPRVGLLPQSCINRNPRLHFLQFTFTKGLRAQTQASTSNLL